MVLQPCSIALKGVL